MKLCINKYTTCLFALFVCAMAHADAPKDYVSCFAAWDANMHTLQTAFTQTTEYDGILMMQSKGQIFYEQKGPKLRLDTLEDGQVSQSALTNKKQIYILDEKGKEISKIAWQDWLSGQPNQALFDFGHYTELLKRHNVSVLDKKNNQVVLRLTPTDKNEHYVLYVTLGEEDCFPQAIMIEADLMKNTAILTDTKRNLTHKTDTFKGLK